VILQSRLVTAETSQRNQDRMARALLMAVMAVLCGVTWSKWGSVVIDCGREMYVPAALNQGKRLYFDIWYPYGPLIPYWHALVFRIFGAHLWLLETAGMTIAAATALLVYALARIFLPASLAFTAGFAYLVQAFQPGIFNYVLPYSYPAAYAVLMFAALTGALVMDARHPKPWALPAAGSLAGLELLTKIEFGLAACVVLGGAILLRGLRSRSTMELAKGVACCAPGILLAAGVYGWYVRAGSANLIFGENIAILPDAYFTRAMGSHWAYMTGSTAPSGTIFRWALYGLLGVPLTAAAIRVASKSHRGAVMIAAAALGVAGLHLTLVYAKQSQNVDVPAAMLTFAPFFYFNRGMALTAAVLLLWTMLEWRRGGIGAHGAALALLLLAGIVLNSRTVFRTEIESYSIFYDALVFPGYLAALKKLTDFLRLADSGRAWVWTSGLLCCGLVSLTAPSYARVLERTYPVGSARGVIYEDAWTGRAFTAALAFLNESRMRSEKFVVWPEEAALYYFSGASAPARWLCVTPGLLPPGEVTSKFLDELNGQRVKYVALSNRVAWEYGTPTFGIDYNQPLYRWLESNFQVVRTFGDYRRERPAHWAVQIWERKRESAEWASR
jgi:hypothetical protein